MRTPGLRRRVPQARAARRGRAVSIDVLVVSLGVDGRPARGGRRARRRPAPRRRVGRDGRADRPREVRTFALTELVWALAARRAARAGIAAHAPRAVVYSSVGAALLWPRPGAIRFDAPAGRQPPGPARGLAAAGGARAASRRRRCCCRGATAPAEAPATRRRHPRAGRAERLIRTRTSRRHLRRQSGEEGPRPRARRVARRRAGDGEELVRRRPRGRRRATASRYAGPLPRTSTGRCCARARVFVTAPRREDFGLAQLEALADGCVLVTTAAPGPYAALPLARALDPRLVGDDLAARSARRSTTPSPGYAERARELLQPFSPGAPSTPCCATGCCRPCGRLAVAGERGA